MSTVLASRLGAENCLQTKKSLQFQHEGIQYCCQANARLFSHQVGEPVNLNMSFSKILSWVFAELMVSGDGRIKFAKTRSGIRPWR